MTAIHTHNIIHEHISYTVYIIIFASWFMRSPKIPKLMKNMYIGLIIFMVFKLIYLIVWAYNYEPPLNEVRKFLNRTTTDTKVYIDNLLVVEPWYIIKKLKQTKYIRPSHGHKYPFKQTNEYTILIVNKDENMTIELKQDSQWKWEYYIQNLGVSRTIFIDPIKVIENGKTVEKQF